MRSALPFVFGLLSLASPLHSAQVEGLLHAPLPEIQFESVHGIDIGGIGDLFGAPVLLYRIRDYVPDRLADREARKVKKILAKRALYEETHGLIMFAIIEGAKRDDRDPRKFLDKIGVDHPYGVVASGKLSEILGRAAYALSDGILIGAYGLCVEQYQGNLDSVPKAHLSMKPWEFRDEGKRLMEALGRRKFAKAVAAAEKLEAKYSGLTDQISAICEAESERVAQLESQGNFWGAMAVAERMSKECKGLPAGHSAKALIKSIKADRGKRDQLKAQKKVRDLVYERTKNVYVVNHGAYLKRMRQLEKIRDDFPETFVSREAQREIDELASMVICKGCNYPRRKCQC
ncbi:MAG: hypothetical protein DWQ01_10170 [Planctomycetota bacterium]|nr:MAG: hypothetical protein DWQ01_10170 [Planctomycetota bacterium]